VDETSPQVAHWRVTLTAAVRHTGLRAVTMAAVLSAGAMLWSTVVAPATSASSGYSVHQGVDSCAVPTTSQLNALWAGTPFHQWGYYLGGATAQAAGCAAWSASKLATARGIGWGFTPIWDDLQAPTGCGGSFSHRMSINTSTARSQGVTSANNAQAAMLAAGFSSSDQVWLDIEGYSYTTSGCKAAVNAYVDGWSATLGTNAGVYGSATGSQVDSWASIANPPLMVWIAVYNGPTSNPNTVWNISGVSNSHWNVDHRMHQYRNSRTYSGILVDVDCAVAWVDQGSTTGESETNEVNELGSITAEPVCPGATQP